MDGHINHLRKERKQNKGINLFKKDAMEYFLNHLERWFTMEANSHSEIDVVQQPFINS